MKKRSSFNPVIIIVFTFLSSVHLFINYDLLIAMTSPGSVINNGSPGLVFTLVNDGYTVTAGTATNGNVIIPASHSGLPVTGIGNSAFYNCKTLTNITLPSSITIIGQSAFNSCTGLKILTIPTSVTDIGQYAFWGCTGLPSITIPASVARIEDGAFQYCYNLSSVIVQGTSPPVINSAAQVFSNCIAGLQIFVPAGSLEIYRKSAGWIDYSNNISLYSEWHRATITENDNGSTPDFSAIDAEVKAMPPAGSITDVVGRIRSLSHNDWERIRGAYDWIAFNIIYDFAALKGKPTKIDPEGVFETRKTICEGYSLLFLAMITDLGLQATMVTGYVRPTTTDNHAWDAVKVNGEWHLFDPCWGAGGLDYKSNVDNYLNFWFDTDPRLFVYNHFPYDTNWLLLTNNITFSDYNSLPMPNSFELENLLKSGHSVEEVLKIAEQPPFFIELNGGFNWSFLGAPLGVNSGGAAFGGGIYYGDNKGYAIGLDAEYLPVISGDGTLSSGSTAMQTVCITILSGSDSGWYSDLGFGIGFYSTTGSVGGFSSGTTFNSYLAKLGGGYNMSFNRNIGAGLGYDYYYPFSGLSQKYLGMSSFPNDLLLDIKLNLIYHF